MYGENMERQLTKTEILELLKKRYILAAVSTTCAGVFYVKLLANKYIFSNANAKFRFAEEEFLKNLSQYRFYLIEDKNQIEINPDFDKLTLKQ